MVVRYNCVVVSPVSGKQVFIRYNLSISVPPLFPFPGFIVIAIHFMLITIDVNNMYGPPPQISVVAQQSRKIAFYGYCFCSLISMIVNMYLYLDLLECAV